MWLVWALMGVTFASTALIIDKTVLDGRERSAADVAVIAGMLSGATSIALFAAGGIPHMEAQFVENALIGGALLFGYLPPYFAALRDSSADRVAAWFQMTPLVAAAAAMLVLGQRLSSMQWVGALCLVGGALAAETIKAGGIHRVARRSILLILTAATIFAASEVFLARASDQAPNFRLLIAMSSAGTALGALAFWLLTSRAPIRMRRRNNRLLSLLVAAEVLNLLFVTMHQRALGLASVGVVSATVGVQPLIIAALVTAKNRATKHARQNPATLATFAAYLSIALGVALVAIGGNQR